MVKKQDADVRQGFARRLNQALDHAKVPAGWGRQTRAAKLLGVTTRAVSKWLNGEAMPEMKRLPLIARKLRVRAEWLLSGTGDMLQDLPARLPSVPVLGTTEAGMTDKALDAVHVHLAIPSNDPAAFALRATTDRLSPRIRTGECALIEPQYEPKPGDEVVLWTADQFLVRELIAIHDDEVLIKRLEEPREREILARDAITNMHVITGVFRATAIRRD